MRRAPEPMEPSERIAKRADLGGRAHVRSAAELGGVARHLDDADDVAVLLAEQHHRPQAARFLDRRLEDVHGKPFEDLLVDAALDLVSLLCGQRAARG